MVPPFCRPAGRRVAAARGAAAADAMRQLLWQLCHRFASSLMSEVAWGVERVMRVRAQ